MRARKAGIATLLPLAALGVSCGSAQPQDLPGPAPATSSVATALKVEEVAGGLEHGWDAGFLPSGEVLVPQRPGRIALVSGTTPGSAVTEVQADLADVYARGEGGLMGLVVHPDFAETRRFTTCQTHQENGQPVDVRLVTWTLSQDGSSAERGADLLTGLPLNSSGRHSGCRPAIGPQGELLVGTGDSAAAPVPQDRSSLGGKVLRIDLETGAALPDNPFADSQDPAEQRVYSYGHRNIQGMAVRPGNGQIFAAEHGPSVDDEVNVIRPGGNYGWDPSRGGTEESYDESVPMTDTERFPDAVRPVWTSGSITEAICGAAFVSGGQWGGLDGALAVVALKGQKMLLLTLDESGEVTEVTLPPELEDYGRLRSVRSGPDGALYVTTSNGGDDKLLRVTPTP
ncbi:Glucose/arabinose dehydrogenase, beta-propeller fold [Amycolatopsis marina]|uniref:Glucose/arabinose dehydrogenase, beta-propeller fold n=1 Tax=Amycolatopsis marina TaxID=490629 RepID=A0A1I1BCH8_9PSEU|nr:PQQ-dependent sugar dehydrogenase [Amycolatopsis marina]SFB47482.1 Glucose/arabinose dehydrogenase, beta-propeller fold [Amycolatopsis marina]